jgi:hypothetical protein
VDVNKLTTYDVEYLFLHIRAKSVGETADITLPCEKSGERKAVTLNLTDAYVKNLDSFESEKTIKITDDVGIVVKPFTLSQIRKVGDSSDAELTTFIDSLPHKVLQEVSDYMESIPTLVMDVEFTGSTGHKNNIQLKGLNSFFV